MQLHKGYIYIRVHHAYDEFDVCKVGITSNVPNRESTYITSEFNRGIFKLIFEVPIKALASLEILLHGEFKEFHKQDTGGTEFFDKQIMELIEPWLQKIGIEYKKLSEEEIAQLARIKEEKDKAFYIPRDYQRNIIAQAIVHFCKENKGLLVQPCGLGKTLMACWIAKDANTILIGVPNTLLLKQWKSTILKIFQDIPILMVCSGIDITDIIEFLKKHGGRFVIITTYNSSIKVYQATRQQSFKFDMKILDEVHHLTSTDKNKAYTGDTYVQMLRIQSTKQLGLTATLKQIEGILANKEIISNNDEKYFGQIIDQNCLLWAIQKNIVCDYAIQTIIANEDEEIFKNENFTDKRLFLGAYVALKSILEGYSHHLLVYSNSIENSIKIVKYLKTLLDSYFPNLAVFCSDYNSKIDTVRQRAIISTFEKSQYGIISCVYSLGEGWDIAILDGVVFAENMVSNIRIVQSALRPCRKYLKEPDKRNKIILPILTNDEWLENDDFKKVKDVIYHMGLEDETIWEKVKVGKLTTATTPTSSAKGKSEDFDKYDEELIQRLKLCTRKRVALDITYEKAKRILADKNIKGKEEYRRYCDTDLRLPKEPEEMFKGKFRNWADYLNIRGNYYDFETCQQKLKIYLQQYPELDGIHANFTSICKKLCEIDAKFPPKELWADYYRVHDLTDIMNTTQRRNKK